MGLIAGQQDLAFKHEYPSLMVSNEWLILTHSEIVYYKSTQTTNMEDKIEHIKGQY
jgi:hypothetical protein